MVEGNCTHPPRKSACRVEAYSVVTVGFDIFAIYPWRPGVSDQSSMPASRFAAFTFSWVFDSRKIVSRCAAGEPPPWISEMVSALSMAIFSISRNILTRFSTGDVARPLEVLLQERADLGIVEIPVGRQIRDKTAGDVDHQPRRLGHLLALVDLGGVGQNRVDEVGARRHPLALVGGGQASSRTASRRDGSCR